MFPAAGVEGWWGSGPPTLLLLPSARTPTLPPNPPPQTDRQGECRLYVAAFCQALLAEPLPDHRSFPRCISKMALLLNVDLAAEDAGLQKLLTEAKVPQPAIAWLTGTEATCLGIESLTDFISSFSSTGFETEIQQKVQTAAIAELKENTVMMNQTVSRLRHAYRSAAAAITAPTTAQTAQPPPPPPQDPEAPLPDQTKQDLTAEWASRYNITVQSRLMGCDTLVSRTYREWQKSTPTVPDISKIRNQTSMLKPLQERREQLTRDLTLLQHTEEVDDRAVSDVNEMYLKLRTLANVWALVGNHEVASKVKPEAKVRMISLEQALGYADNVLYWTMGCGLPHNQRLAWARANDQATRTTMMEKCASAGRPERHSSMLSTFIGRTGVRPSPFPRTAQGAHRLDRRNVAVPTALVALVQGRVMWSAWLREASDFAQPSTRAPARGPEIVALRGICTSAT